MSELAKLEVFALAVVLFCWLVVPPLIDTVIIP